MEKLKIDKKKHNHKLTDLLKVAIFSLIMLAPMFAIVSKCVYVACNKNAKDSYYGETINETKYKQIIPSNIEIGKDYLINFNNETSTQTIRFYINATNVEALYNNTEYNYETARIEIFDSNNICAIRLKNVENTITYFSTTDSATIKFTFYSWIQNINANDIDYIYSIIFNKYSYLDNVFYYAVEEIKENTLFNWTTDTAIYSAINGMCNGLAVQNGVLPILLTYWSLMTAIYIVFDIIIFTFTKITHFVNND